MVYRREIDGLRALAVLPVILFHADFEAFGGGFVGVDVFFVISGYLITTIILAEIEQGKFSIVNFYERRARRILPALFLVMAASLVAGYFTLMPDEFKNLGQSLVATSLFSNNILLALTGGYWELAGEFKPLLHTWSLGVEEQYYVIVPILLLLAWRFCKDKIPLLLAALFVGSFVFAVWFVAVSPRWASQILPTRAWEIAIGALAAVLLRSNPQLIAPLPASNALSSLGLALIIWSIFFFDRTIPSPGFYLLAPTIGAVLVIVFAREGTLAHLLLGHRVCVFFGLLSYSLYLWHQPIFAYLRAYSVEKPSQLAFGVSAVFALVLACLSWKFIETPFRSKKFIRRRSVFALSLLGSAFFIATGLYLNKNYGLPTRVFDSSVRIEDMDKRIYNEKVFAFKADAFSDGSRQKLLIVGNSFARDFTNITLETYDVSNVEIVYRDDLQECIFPYEDAVAQNLFSEADVVVFGSGEVRKDCLDSDLMFASSNNKKIFYVGTKDFGYNLNWLIRLGANDRSNRYNVISERVINADVAAAEIVPSKSYISLLAPTLVANAVPITDELGRMISTDRAHLTRYGAIYFGRTAVKKSSYSEIFVRAHL